MSAVGDNIRALRTLYGDGRDLTQGELAAIAGVTRETVNKWESGAIGNVRTANLNRIRSHFGLSDDDLRSESAGLAAQLRRARPAVHAVPERGVAAPSAATVPTISLADLRAHLGEVEASRLVEVPRAQEACQPHSFALVVDDATASVVGTVVWWQPAG